jgi:penicillin amidase
MVRRPWLFTVPVVVLVLLPALLIGHVRSRAAHSRLPELGHEVTRLPGLVDPVEVRIDGLGIPHVRAATDGDAWFAQGYLHARERFFQMELSRRAASGRLSEIFGEALLVEDRKMRILRLLATARRQAALLDDAEIEVLRSYSAGVNAALRDYGRWIAPEIWALGLEPEPWTTEDTLGIGVLFQLNLTWAMGEELRRSVEHARYGVDLATELWGWTPSQARRWIPPVEPVGHPRRPDEAITPPLMGGSNNWALAPHRTATGRPILANDPHVGVATPSTWYGIHLTTPTMDVIGASVAGAPGVLIGHNQRVAWGFTMSMMDDQDLFVVTIDEQGDAELADGAWLPLRTITEEITIRWRSEPELLKVRMSRLGPLVRERGTTGLALSWTAYHGPSAIRAFLGMATAEDVGDLIAAWNEVSAPSMNLVAADVEGTIGHQVVGLQPGRRRGAGRLPAPGDESIWSWDDLLPFAANPGVLNPESGTIVTANHDLFLEGDYPSAEAFPGEFSSPWRVRRIRQQLASHDAWTVDACRELQLDVASGRAVAVLRSLWPDLQSHGGPTARALLAWDGRLTAEGPEGWLWSRLHLELAEAVGGDDALEAGLEDSPFRGDRLLRLLVGGLSDRWWDDARTDAIEGREAIVRRVLDRLDDEPTAERWGAVHTVSFDHALGTAPLIGGLFRAIGSRGPVEVPGDGTTVNATYWSGRDSFGVTAFPSLRFVADVGAWDNSLFVLPLGQSGRPWSVHYDDHLVAWNQGRGLPLPYSAEAVERATRAVVRLTPEEDAP